MQMGREFRAEVKRMKMCYVVNQSQEGCTHSVLQTYTNKENQCPCQNQDSTTEGHRAVCGRLSSTPEDRGAGDVAGCWRGDQAPGINLTVRDPEDIP